MMIPEAENPVLRDSARHIGESLGADYCMFDIDDHNNVNIVLKFGDFDADTPVQDIIDHITE